MTAGREGNHKGCPYKGTTGAHINRTSLSDVFRQAHMQRFISRADYHFEDAAARYSFNYCRRIMYGWRFLRGPG